MAEIKRIVEYEHFHYIFLDSLYSIILHKTLVFLYAYLQYKYIKSAKIERNYKIMVLRKIIFICMSMHQTVMASKISPIHTFDNHASTSITMIHSNQNNQQPMIIDPILTARSSFSASPSTVPSKLSNSVSLSSGMSDQKIKPMVGKKTIATTMKQKISDFLFGSPDLNRYNRQGKRPLHQAIFDQDVQQFIKLINAGADINAPDQHGNQALHLVIKSMVEGVDATKLEAMAQYLLDHGADVNACNNQLQTPLHDAVITLNLQLVELLIDRGAKINAQDALGQTPLYTLVVRGMPSVEKNRRDLTDLQVDIVDFLLRSGADITIANYQGRLPVDQVNYQIVYHGMSPAVGDLIARSYRKQFKKS